MSRKTLDHYSLRAKALGFQARSVFKLEEIDKRHRLFRGGMRVLDLGCSPGSWCQYASSAVGPTGRVVGLDLTPVALGLPNVHTVVADVFKWTPTPELHRHFDVVLSDMMSNTTSSQQLDADRSIDLCLRVCELASVVLKPGGTVCLKVFQGKGFVPFFKTLKETYKDVHTVKPASSRSESKEIFLLGRGQLKPFALADFERHEG